MDNETVDILLPRLKQQLWILWGAFVVAAGIYLRLIYLLAPRISKHPLPVTHTIVYPVLALLSLSCVGCFYFLEKVLLAPDHLSQKSKKEIFGLFVTTFLVGCSLVEGAAIVGLLLFFLGEPMKIVWRFFGFCFFIQAVYILPKISAYVELARTALNCQYESSEQSGARF